MFIIFRIMICKREKYKNKYGSGSIILLCLLNVGCVPGLCWKYIINYSDIYKNFFFESFPFSVIHCFIVSLISDKIFPGFLYFFFLHYCDKLPYYCTLLFFSFSILFLYYCFISFSENVATELFGFCRYVIWVLFGYWFVMLLCFFQVLLIPLFHLLHNN